jgi:hypothetical protein
MKPKFLVEPQCLEFPRKIIVNAEKMYPQPQDIILSNPEKSEIRWRIDEKFLEEDKIF